MMTLILAAAVAAQPAPRANPHGQMAPGQHEAMKDDCCKDCCKDMADKHSGHGSERGRHSAQ
jgi:hypothetical protein